MAIARWNPRQTYTKAEEWIMRRLGRTRKLFAFLRAQWHELFEDAFQAELETMYRDTGAGKPPVPPALLAMVTWLQAYLTVSDAEAVEVSGVDRRWHLVLDCWDATEPPFSQGALGEFRVRRIRTDLDRRRLERTVTLARQTQGFDARKLPKPCAWPLLPVRGKGPGAWKRRSICWAMPRAKGWRASPGCWAARRRRWPAKRGFRCSWPPV